MQKWWFGIPNYSLEEAGGEEIKNAVFRDPNNLTRAPPSKNKTPKNPTRGKKGGGGQGGGAVEKISSTPQQIQVTPSTKGSKPPVKLQLQSQKKGENKKVPRKAHN